MVGTRPEAIKMAPVAHALNERRLRPSLILTGQHADLDHADFGLGTFAAERLSCPGEPDPDRHVRSVTAALTPKLNVAPDLIVVQGDTSSALGAALAGFTAGVAVAHVEAGLRTHDPLLPWPEEGYRTAIDRQADLLFAPTELAATNLRAELVPGEIHVTGNTSIDALLAVEQSLPQSKERTDGRSQLLVTAHRRESWGEGLRSIAAALRELSADALIDFVLHPNAHVAATMREELEGIENVRLVQPCGHSELVRRMRDCDLILSDSGGIQEEAPALGVPLLVLREKTERPEGLADDRVVLVGTSPGRIVAEARRLMAKEGLQERSFPYGDGTAGQRIAAAVEQWLLAARRARSSPHGGRATAISH